MGARIAAHLANAGIPTHLLDIGPGNKIVDAGLDAARKFAEEMEYETARFYRRASQSARDDAVRDLLKKLAAAEEKHEQLAHDLGEKISPKARATEDQTAKRMFMLPASGGAMELIPGTNFANTSNWRPRR